VTATPRALSIAGSDSGGGAGIQADLKAFARCGVHGACAITAITAQNTVGVSAIYPIPPEIVRAQIRAVVEDIGVQAVKVGMLGTADVTLAVAQALDELPAGTPVVVDPVMVSESGARLLQAGAERALIEEILPRATVLTPNLPEAQVLVQSAAQADRAGEDAADDDVQGGVALGAESAEVPGAESGIEPGTEELHELVRAVLALGPRIVVLTGGHRAQAVDLFLDSADRSRIVEIPGERHPGGASHGSGCTHASVLAARLALEDTPLQAARAARALAGDAVAGGLADVGAGAGPVDVLGLAALRESANRRLQ
jgi:hydroxymethylpyrimidine/phosphomethylpyrimidine kinase